MSTVFGRVSFAALSLLSVVAIAQDSTEANRKDAVGQKAPVFKLKDSKGKEVDLAKVIGKKPIVLVFYRGNW